MRNRRGVGYKRDLSACPLAFPQNQGELGPSQVLVGGEQQFLLPQYPPLMEFAEGLGGLKPPQVRGSYLPPSLSHFPRPFVPVPPSWRFEGIGV